MHKMTFFPLENADCIRIDLENGKKVLFDYADVRDPADGTDKRCDLPLELRRDLEDAGRHSFDVVAFTHLDRDHFTGSTEFFYLQHSAKYQDETRIKIDVMWVPSALITEQGPENTEAQIIQREARYRLRQGKGIRVFSRPERLRQWCARNGIDLDDRLHLITDAGQVAPELNLRVDGVEFFIHSPFAVRQNERSVEDRNGDSLIVQATFSVGGQITRALLMADSTYESLGNIVDITLAHSNDSRLEWDISKLPHHCSYRSLGPDKAEDKTTPTEQVSWLYEQQGQEGAIVVSTSKPIPAKGSDEDEDPQPPHRQAANYYREVIDGKDGHFVVTMEHPSKESPKPLVIEIGADKCTLKKPLSAASVAVTSRRAPRAG